MLRYTAHSLCVYLYTTTSLTACKEHETLPQKAMHSLHEVEIIGSLEPDLPRLFCRLFALCHLGTRDANATVVLQIHFRVPPSRQAAGSRDVSQGARDRARHVGVHTGRGYAYQG
jgi:hypothetical protein